jgi:hypothetical protein
MREGLLVVGATLALGLGGVLARVHAAPSSAAAPGLSAVRPLEWRLPGQAVDFLCPDTLAQPLLGIGADGRGLTQI